MTFCWSIVLNGQNSTSQYTTIRVYNIIYISISSPYILAEMPEDEEVSLVAVIIPKEIKTTEINYKKIINIIL